MPEATRFKMLLSFAFLLLRERERDRDGSMGKGATTECVPRACRLLFLCLSFYVYRVRELEYSEATEGVWRFFLSFQKISFFDFFVSSGKGRRKSRSKGHAASLTLGVRIRCNRYFLCDV